MVLVAAAGLPLACIQANPDFDPRASAGELGTDEFADDEDEDEGEDGETQAGESEDEESGDDDPDTAAVGECGDGIVDDDEECDDGNEDNADGCLEYCVIPRSCAEILVLFPDSASGPYLVDPRAVGEPWPVICDMELDGGGWTGFEVQDTCNGHLDSTVAALWPAQSEGVDESCRPFSANELEGTQAYAWDIEFPPGFAAFFLRDYTVRSIGTPEFIFPQSVWAVPFDFPNGAISLGDANDFGPVANWAVDGGVAGTLEEDAIVHYPVLDEPFVLDAPTSVLRIAWGEHGIEPEGLYPWWSGQVFVR